MNTTTAVTHKEGEAPLMVPRRVVVTTVAMGRRQAVVGVAAATIRQTIRQAAMATLHRRVVTSWHGLSHLQPTMARHPMVDTPHHILRMAMVHHRLAMDRQCMVMECPHPIQAMARRLVTGHRLAVATTHDTQILHPGERGVNGGQA